MTLVANHPKTLFFETTDGVARGVTIAGEHLLVGAAMGVASNLVLSPMAFALGGTMGEQMIQSFGFFAHTIGVPLWRFGYEPTDLALTIPSQMAGASLLGGY